MSQTISRALLPAILLSSITAAAWADWDPGDPYKMHYPQLPDLTPAGLDVLAGPWLPAPTDITVYYEKFLADDWLCTSTGPVTDIHFWGSYNQDRQPVAPQDAYFSLVIYDNIPAGVGGANYSRPGNPLWSTYTKATATRLYATAQEQFYDPNTSAILGTDTEVWQYNFKFPETAAFHQNAGEIYWLGIHHSFDLNGDGVVNLLDLAVFAANHPGTFGWKTSGVQHFEDDAVFTDVYTFGGSPHVVPAAGWRELRNPFTGESLDLSFVITTVPEPSSVLLLMLGLTSLAALGRRGR